MPAGNFEADEAELVGIAIVAALPREIVGLVGGTKPDREPLRRGVHLYRLPGATVVAAGMGAARVTLAVEAALRWAPVEMLLSAGLAGACSAEVRPGDVVEAQTVVDARTGERYAANGGCTHGATLVTSEAIAGVREKARLAASYDADLVDMEAATVARLAMARGLAFRAIKGVSDAHDFEMESMSRFADRHGHFRTGAFALHTAVRPWRWGSAVKLGRTSNRALSRMHEQLREVINEAG